MNLRSTTAMNGCGKSDSSIVPVKPSNKCCGALQCAERVEERGLTEGNLFSETTSGYKAGEGSDMVNPKQARSGKREIQVMRAEGYCASALLSRNALRRN